MSYVYDYSENNPFLDWWHKLRYEYQIHNLKLN
jgi:hypothetical protein